jgi:hypothetical protein
MFQTKILAKMAWLQDMFLCLEVTPHQPSNKEPSMTRVVTVKNRSPEKCIRAVGIRLDQFLTLRDQMLICIRAEQEARPMKKRGKKAVILTVEDKLRLTLTYLRHYPTFEQIGQQFGICESYAHKVYQQYLDRLVNVCHLPGRKALLDADLMAILMDVTEQPIERPTRHQRG